MKRLGWRNFVALAIASAMCAGVAVYARQSQPAADPAIGQPCSLTYLVPTWYAGPAMVGQPINYEVKSAVRHGYFVKRDESGVTIAGVLGWQDGKQAYYELMLIPTSSIKSIQATGAFVPPATTDEAPAKK